MALVHFSNKKTLPYKMDIQEEVWERSVSYMFTVTLLLPLFKTQHPSLRPPTKSRNPEAVSEYRPGSYNEQQLQVQCAVRDSFQKDACLGSVQAGTLVKMRSVQCQSQ